MQAVAQQLVPQMHALQTKHEGEVVANPKESVLVLHKYAEGATKHMSLLKSMENPATGGGVRVLDLGVEIPAAEKLRLSDQPTTHRWTLMRPSFQVRMAPVRPPPRRLSLLRSLMWMVYLSMRRALEHPSGRRALPDGLTEIRQ